MASSGLAPESLPSNSLAVLTNTQKFAPFLWKPKKKEVLCQELEGLWGVLVLNRANHPDTYHKIGIAYVMLDNTSPQYDHASIFGIHSLAVHASHICVKTNKWTNLYDNQQGLDVS